MPKKQKRDRIPFRWLWELWSPRLTVLFVASILILGAASLMSFRSLATLRAGNTWVLHTERVRLAIGRVLQLLTDIETGVRGYALSDDKQFLEPYDAALPQVPQALSTLKQLISDNPTQRMYATQLDDRAQARIAYAQSVVERIESGNLGAGRAMISDAEGKRRMDAVRAVALDMESEETRLLVLRSHLSDKAIRDTELILYTSSALAVLLLLIIAYSTTRYSAKLRHGEKTLGTTLRSVGDAVMSTNAAGAIQFMNPVAEALTGWDQKSAQGRPLDEVFRIVNEQTRAPVENPVTKVVREGIIIGLANHTVLIARDGTERAIEDSGAPIIDGNDLVGVVLVFRDATSERAAQRALLASEQRFVGLANTIPQLAWTNRPDGTFEYFNQGWYAYTGLNEYETLGTDVWRLVVHPEDIQRTLRIWNHSLSVEVPYEVEFRLRRHDGAYRWFLARAIAAQNPEGRVIEWFGTCTDIDTSKRNEESLRATEAALREVDLRKDVFLATLSHELRNPLAPIRNAASILASDTLKPADIERSRLIIARQVRHMASLLDDLLDLSRITRGAFTLKKEYVNLQQVLTEAVESARPGIDAKRHKLTLDWPADPIEIEVDPIRLVQIIGNLLTNAAKYTDPEGSITLGAHVEGNGVAIFVRDSGVGLAPHMLGRVFEMFTQVEPPQGRTEGGLGIGLALVKGLVELHGGRIVARSEGLERGSEFVVSLPSVRVVTGTVKQRTSSSSAANGGGLRVLVADDNRDGADSLRMMFEQAGHEVYTAYNGADALQLAIRHRPRVAILDIGMPGMDGYEVARRIRYEAWGASVTLIALTGWGQEDDKRRAMRAGFDHHLTKPVDPEALTGLITPSKGA